MILSRQQGWTALLFHAGIVGAFSIVLIGAGHGVAPIGLLLVLGAAEEWYPPMTVGWAAIGTLAIAAFIPWQLPHRVLSAVGLLALLVSWVMFISLSEIIPITLALSIPYLAACVGRIVHLAAGARRTAAEDPSPRGGSLGDGPA